jgi:hypothetical protein
MPSENNLLPRAPKYRIHFGRSVFPVPNVATMSRKNLQSMAMTATVGSVGYNVKTL